MPLYESTVDVVKSEIATFFDVFPNGTVWSNDIDGDGYDVVLLAKQEPLTIDGELQARLDRPDHARHRRRARRGGVHRRRRRCWRPTAGRRATSAPWLADAEINRDGNLRLQYLAGMGFNVYDSSIYQMLAHRRYPENLFTGSGEWKERLRQVVARERVTNDGQGPGSQ